MVETLLPSSSTSWEKATARASDFEANVLSAIDALKTFKYSPPASLLDFLIYEKGLSELTHFVENKYELWTEGEDYLAIRGTEPCLDKGLGWLGRSAGYEYSSPHHVFWNLFQANLAAIETDIASLAQIEGVLNHASAFRSHFWRGFCDYDVRPVSLDRTSLDGGHLEEFSGVRVRENGPLWSFGRNYDIRQTITQAELEAIGVWIAPAGEVQDLGWENISWADINASWSDSGEVVRKGAMLSAIKSRFSHVAFFDAEGAAIGYRRKKMCHFVEPDINGTIEFDGMKYAISSDPTNELLCRCLTMFGDGQNEHAKTVQIALDGQPASTLSPGTPFLRSGELDGFILPIAPQALDIEFAQTVREQVSFLLTI
jgi:hypothetical protein